MCHVRDYEEDDVFKVRIRADDPMGAPVSNYPGRAWSLVEGDDVLACMGIINNCSGIGTLWAFVSDDARAHPLAVFKESKQRVDAAFSEMKYHRLQSIVRADRDEYTRFIELLGFQPEALMKKATAGQDDLWLYARVA